MFQAVIAQIGVIGEKGDPGLVNSLRSPAKKQMIDQRQHRQIESVGSVKQQHPVAGESEIVVPAQGVSQSIAALERQRPVGENPLEPEKCVVPPAESIPALETQIKASETVSAPLRSTGGFRLHTTPET